MDSFIIWQGNLGDIYEGQTHRIRQIADDDCIVEFSGESGPDDGGWEAEETDWVCSSAYMRAFLAARGIDREMRHLVEVRNVGGDDPFAQARLFVNGFGIANWSWRGPCANDSTGEQYANEVARCLRDALEPKCVLRGIVFEIWANDRGVPCTLSTPSNMQKLIPTFDDGERPLLSFLAGSWEEATAYYKELQQEMWG